MGKAKRTILAAACAAALVVGSVAATVAYLTSTDTVTNTFTVGNVAITLDEASVDELGVAYDASEVTAGQKDNEGRAISAADGKVARVDSNTYKLLPGHEYVKDPTVHVAAGSEDCYLFVKVENKLASFLVGSTEEANIEKQMASKGWKALGTGYENIYVYVGAGGDATAPLAVSAGEDVAVFEKVEVASTVDNTTLAGYANKTVTVTAYAVQKDGFENKTAVGIWNTAFPEASSDSEDEEA